MATNVPTPNPDRFIRVQWAVSYWKANAVDGIRLRIEIVEAALMPSKVFQYQLRPKNPNTGEEVAEFDHVSSPPDIEETPEDAPAPGDPRPKWFRLSYVDLLLRSRHEVDDVLAAILEDLRVLKRTYDIISVIEPVGEEVIDGAPPEPAPSSSSSSASEGSESSESSESSDSGSLSSSSSSSSA